jgi:hypothetical protein
MMEAPLGGTIGVRADAIVTRDKIPGGWRLLTEIIDYR